jgi:hypothetical protein
VSVKEEAVIDDEFMVSLKVTVTGVLTATSAAPEEGLIAVIVGGTPSWVTLAFLPATVTRLDRVLAPVFSVTE